MRHYEDLITLVAVLEEGGISRASRRLGVSKSIVSRRLDRLEALLGVRLLQRTTQGVVPTEPGRELQERGTRLIADMEETIAAVAGRDGQVAGSLRLSAPLSFGQRHLAPVVTEFAAQHPRLSIEASYTDRMVDVVHERFDAAIRIGVLEDSSLKARRLSPVHSVLVASPAYIDRHGAPNSLGDLTAHDSIVFTGAPIAAQWRFRNEKRWTTVVPRRVSFRTDSGDAACTAAIGGLGIVPLPTFLAADALRAGLLVTLLSQHQLPERGLYVVWPPAPQPPTKLRHLIDFLSDRFGPRPHWDEW